MTAAFDKSGQPLNAEAWGKASYDSMLKLSKLRSSSKDTKAIAAAEAESNRLQTGYARAQADEAKAAKSKPTAEKAQARYGSP